MVNFRFDRFGLPDTTISGTAESFPAAITDNDRITIYLDLPDTVAVRDYTVVLSGNLKGDEISIVGQGDLSGIPLTGRPQGTQPVTVASSLYSLGTSGPYSAPQVTIRITRTVKNTSVVDRSYAVRIRRTYIAGLRLGAVSSGLRFSDFEAGARSRTDSTTIIRDLSQRHGEVRPYLMLVFYGWRFWTRGFWDGRDIEAEPSGLERLNPMIGAGLRKLGEEWLLGFSFEVARGLDVSASYQTAKVRVLQTGFQVDSVYTGSTPPPTTRVWKSGLGLGVSVDLRVAAGLLSELFPSGSK